MSTITYNVHAVQHSVICSAYMRNIVLAQVVYQAEYCVRYA